MAFYVNQVVDAIRQTETNYEAIFLVGHSLGGIVAESAAVAYLQGYVSGQFPEITPLAAVIYLGAPRAGTQRAIPPLRNLFGEIRALRPMSLNSVAIDDYLASRTEVKLTAPLGADRAFFLPRYAFYSGTDLWANNFSSTFGIPGAQRIPLIVSHTDMPKPGNAEADQVTRLQEIVRDVAAARLQRIRELTHANSRRQIPAVSPTVTTEFWAPPDASHWIRVYNEVRKIATNANVAVLDRNGAESDVDLLISTSHAEDVMNPQSTERRRFDDALARKKSNARLTVGLTPVGTIAETAAEVMLGWHHSTGSTPHILVEGAADVGELRNTMTRWIDLIVSSDPRRGRVDLTSGSDPLFPTERLYDLTDGDIER